MSQRTPAVGATRRPLRTASDIAAEYERSQEQSRERNTQLMRQRGGPIQPPAFLAPSPTGALPPAMPFPVRPGRLLSSNFLPSAAD